MSEYAYRQLQHALVTAPDTTPNEIKFRPPVYVFDIFVLDNDVLMSFSPDGIFYSTERRFVGGFHGSINQQVAAVRYRNRTVGLIATLDITGFFDLVSVPSIPAPLVAL